MQKNGGCQRIRGGLVMSMIVCEVCERDNWSGIRCSKHRVCTSCIDSILEEYFERENNERKREQHKRSSA